MLKTALAAAIVLGSISSARSADKAVFPEIFFDRCEKTTRCPTDKDLFTYGSLAVVECWVGRDRMPKDQAGYLDFARSTFRMKPYSAGTCVSLGVVPDDLTRGAIQH